MHPTPLKSLAVAAASAGLLLTGGVAAAHAGVLPGAAQDAAQTMLDTVGVEVPGADEHSDGHADTHGRSDDAPAGGEADTAGEDGPTHGETISELARTTPAEGADKGSEISTAARSHGQAGEHGSAQAPEQSAAATADESKGDEGGDATEVETPDDASGNGIGTGATASGDRSEAGAGNRP